MSKKISYLLLLVLAVGFASCNETEEESKYHNWRERNEAFIDSLQQVYDRQGTSGDLYAVTDSRNKSQKIFFKKIKGTESKTDERYPLLSSTVKAFYRGMLIDEEVFAATPQPKFYTTQYKQLEVFDGNFSGKDPDANFDTPTEFGVRYLISGWIEVLQWMYPGERWEIYIPWKCAYGESGSDSGEIPGYSTLIFDLELVEITDY